MTTKEAIKWMRETKLGGEVMGDEGVVTACDMAIAALQAQQERENQKPLTLDELRQMDGGPVWVEFHLGLFTPVWMLVNAPEHAAYDSLHQKVCFDCYGDAWLAYRHKPKED